MKRNKHDIIKNETFINKKFQYYFEKKLFF